MIDILKRTIDKEFAANSIAIAARVDVYSVQGNKPLSYQIKLIYKGGQHVMTLRCNATRPFKPMLMPINYIEPHKMVRLCEVITEAFKDLERKGEEGD